MKRLTISMSDALFDKLNQVENKSLFIRKLIEGELQKGIISSSDSTYESLAGDIEDLHHEIQSLSSRMVSIENQISGVKLQSSGASNHALVDSFSLVSPTITPVESGIEISNVSASVNVSVNDAISAEIPSSVDEFNVAVLSDAPDIKINPFGQNTDTVLPVHGDEMHNAPFRSVVNVGMQEEQVSGLADAIEKHAASTVIASDAAIQSKGCLSSSVNNLAPSFVMPEFSEVSTPVTSPFSASPEAPAVSTPSFVMPEFSEVSTPVPSPFSVSPEAPAVSTPSFVMPEFSEVSTPVPSPFSVASPEVSVPSTPSFVIPELSGSVESNSSPFELSPSMSVPLARNDIQMPSFAATNPPVAAIHVQPSCFMQQEVQPQIQNNDSYRVNTSNTSENERLQGNILMYLPHGARIKRSIIKALVSKKFSAEEIDAQINLMISNRSLLVEVEDGAEYLLRS
ncbi:hypothetical protein [uncultured Methanomethylovorans sp.]|uniref:hypothetical protein n=1 Tax=uncultured Methanomethylovorans sp. TaxID=183759 RepID=UPI002AA9575B|nr:hypothetical protein [uncultured Methanomethylovorans sp.]